MSTLPQETASARRSGSGEGRRVLVVEDHLDVAANLIEFLELDGWLPEHAGDGRSGLELAKSGDYEAIVLDLTLPRLDGLEVARELRRQTRPPAILMLTARDTLQERLEGFAVGADDYLVKPFALEELAARLKSICQRHARQARVLEYAGLVLDLDRHEVCRGGESLSLSGTGFCILQRLLEKAPAAVSHDELARLIWGEDPPDGAALRTHVYLLRQRIELPDEELIKTVRGVGYRMSDLD